ncbi:MAG TPA: hypothetical protein VEQ65_08205 [Opitutus sp.]|nr:hypothetical protein [Opitutus sp.]
MSLPASTITLLQDEAYLTLCRGTVEAALEGVTAQKNEVVSTRPPFGILATKKTRAAFVSSLHTVLNTEAELRQRLGKVELLEHALKRRVRAALESYLDEASPQFAKRNGVLAAIDGWESLLDNYGEKLKALARQLREAASAVKQSATPSRDAYENRVHCFALLHRAAAGVDGAAGVLEANAQRLAQAAGPLFASVQLPEPPFIRQTEWVDRVLRLTDPEMMSALARLESAVRALLADSLGELHAKVARVRDQVSALARDYLENYWGQLRSHALQHYVSESDVDDILVGLEERYIAGDIQQRMHELSSVADPYALGR